MKNTILILLIPFIFAFIPFYGHTQNGGQANENRVVKIDYVGWVDNNYIFKITNKQPCRVKVQIKIVTDPYIIDTIINGNSFINFYLNSSNQEEKIIKTRALDFCPRIFPDRGWVEYKLELGTLPIKFKNITAKRLDKNTIQLRFEVEEDNTIHYYKIMISEDGINYFPKTLLFPNGIQGNKIYEVKIKL